MSSRVSETLARRSSVYELVSGAPLILRKISVKQLADAWRESGGGYTLRGRRGGGGKGFFFKIYPNVLV